MDNNYTSQKRNSVTSKFNLQDRKKHKKLQPYYSYDNMEKEDANVKFPVQEDNFQDLNESSTNQLKSRNVEDIQGLKVDRTKQKIEKNSIRVPEEKIIRSLSVS